MLDGLHFISGSLVEQLVPDPWLGLRWTACEGALAGFGSGTEMEELRPGVGWSLRAIGGFGPAYMS